MGDPTTWSTLTKTVDDLTTIVQQIAADLLVHNQDPSAHGQAGEGVYTHRIAAILDHVHGSVDWKHLRDDKFLISTSFSSVDGWAVLINGGSIVNNIMGTVLSTDAPLNSEAELYIDSDDADIELDPAKNPFFQTTFKLSSVTAVTAYIVCGDKEGGGIDDSYGFKIVNNALYAYWTKGGAVNTQAIAGITLTNLNIYRCWLDSTNSKIYFYVNGVLKYTATVNFPTDSDPRFFGYYIKTTEAVVKRITVIDFLFEMDR